MKIQLFIASLIVCIACSSMKEKGRKTKKPPMDIVPNIIANDTLIKDTSAFIQINFINQKNKYLNKELSMLLHDLKITVVSYLTGIASNNRYIVPDIQLSFLNKNETAYRSLYSINKPPILWIKWANPLPADSVSVILQKSKKPGEWGEAEKQYYGKQIVKDFGLVNWRR